jgi:putative protease
MWQLLDDTKKYGISAVIASDWAVIDYCQKIELEIHLSTQCNVTNIEAVRFFARFADVIVLGREVNLQQVADITHAIREEDIRGPKGEWVRIEMFIHGALCMAVSGKCYLSLDNFNYSANRGACLQPCRRGYLVKDIDNEIELAIENQYIMSPKDLCTIHFLDKILKAGVTVLKIEGRGRSAEYVKMVTQCYHEAVSAIQTGEYTREKVEEWTVRLRSVYNRDFWDGYYLGRTMGEWSARYGSQATRVKEFVGKVTNYFSQLCVAEITIETGEINIGDTLLIIGTTTGVVESHVSEIRVDLQSVNSAQKGIPCYIVTPELVRRGDKVYIWKEVMEEF